MNTATATFAAFDETAIWGTGATPEAAIADAVQWINAEDAAALRASCSTAIMTPELAAIVASTGGNTAAIVLADGRLGTDEQHFAQA